MSGIIDIVQQHLTPDTINQISSAIGADPATTQQAIDAAVPMMVSGMATHAGTPGGAATIKTEADHHAGILGQLGGMLGGAGGVGDIIGGLGGMLGNAGGAGGGLGGILGSAAAGGILGKVLGSSHGDVTDGVTQATGLDSGKATKLLMILAPIVLAAIAHHRSSAAASPAQVEDVLQQEAQAQVSSHRYGGILGGILNKATGQA